MPCFSQDKEKTALNHKVNESFIQFGEKGFNRRIKRRGCSALARWPGRRRSSPAANRDQRRQFFRQGRRRDPVLVAAPGPGSARRSPRRGRAGRPATPPRADAIGGGIDRGHRLDHLGAQLGIGGCRAARRRAPRPARAWSSPAGGDRAVVDALAVGMDAKLSARISEAQRSGAAWCMAMATTPPSDRPQMCARSISSASIAARIARRNRRASCLRARDRFRHSRDNRTRSRAATPEMLELRRHTPLSEPTPCRKTIGVASPPPASSSRCAPARSLMLAIAAIWAAARFASGAQASLPPHDQHDRQRRSDPYRLDPERPCCGRCATRPT
jgi:hypothetical protein